MTTVVSAAALVTSLLLQPGGPVPSSPLVLQITYSDGRVVAQTVGPGSGNSWTPMFPRVSGWMLPASTLPATAVEYRWTREGDGVRVRVSLRFGTPHQDERLVADVLVGPGAPVRVAALREFGVEPVELSLAGHEATSIAPPAVIGKTTGLEVVSIEPQLEPVPHYVVTVRNVRDVPVLSFHQQWYRGGTRELSGQQGVRTAEPIVDARGTYTYRVRIGAEQAAPDDAWRARPLDGLAVTSVLWADGVVEGEPGPAASALVLYLGRRTQLGRVVPIYRDALQAGETTAEARRHAIVARLEGLPRIPDPALIGTARSLHPAVESLTHQAIEGALAAGFNDVRVEYLRSLTGPHASQLPADPLTLDGLIRDGLAAAERWLSTVSAALPR